MRLFYWKTESGNFGDDLNEWLWQELHPEGWSDESDVLFCGIGTIIGNTLPDARKIVVFSSGAGYSKPPSDFHSERWDVRAVRGPLSARVLGLPPQAAVADGALLLARLPGMSPIPAEERRGVLFVPHHQSTEDKGLREAAALAGVEFLDPRQPSHLVIAKLRSAKLVIADSMHAAIIADLFRTPWIPVATSPLNNTFKWLDWAMSLGLPYEPTQLPPASLLTSYGHWELNTDGKALQVVPVDVDRAVERFTQIGQQTSRSLLSRKPAKAARRRIKSAIRRLGAQPSPIAPIDRRMTERTAAVLAAQATRSGFLSDDTTLASRIDELSARFDALWRTASD